LNQEQKTTARSRVTQLVKIVPSSQ
jgi:hypothetical protein